MKLKTLFGAPIILMVLLFVASVCMAQALFPVKEKLPDGISIVAEVTLESHSLQLSRDRLSLLDPLSYRVTVPAAAPGCSSLKHALDNALKRRIDTVDRTLQFKPAPSPGRPLYQLPRDGRVALLSPRPWENRPAFLVMRL